MRLRAGRTLKCVFLATALAGCREAPPPASPDLRAAIDVYLQRSYNERPVWATEVGAHAVDGQLDDFAPAAVGARSRWLQEEERRFTAIDPSPLTPNDRADRDVVLASIAAARLEIETLRTWQTNPLFYTQLAGDAVHSLLARDYAPLPDRLTAASRRQQLLPRLLEQARANVVHPARPHTEAAIRQTDAVVRLIEQDLTAAALDPRVPTPLARELRGAAGGAIAALATHQTYLERDLLPRSDGEFRLGRPRFDAALGIELQTAWTSTELQRRATAETGRIRRAMYDVALPLWQADHPGIQPPSPDRDVGIDSVVAPVLARIAADHPRPDELLASCRAAVDSLRQFVARTGIVSLDPRADLVVRWTPDFARGTTIAGLDPPGPLEPQLPSSYFVQAIPTDWPADQVESFLREYNSAMLQVLSMHEAVPGHFVQHCHARRTQHVVRNVFANAAFEEGWAVYAEDLAVAAGYGSGDPRLRLEQLKFRLRTVLNARLDAGVHCDGMSQAEAMDLLTRIGFQETSEARGKWLRAQLTATQLSAYYVGLEEIRSLEGADRVRAGSAWSKRDFVERLLAHGSLPVRNLRTLLLPADRANEAGSVAAP